MFCDDIQDMDLTNELQSLMAFFANMATDILTKMIKSKESEWISSQAYFNVHTKVVTKKADRV